MIKSPTRSTCLTCCTATHRIITRKVASVQAPRPGCSNCCCCGEVCQVTISLFQNCSVGTLQNNLSYLQLYLRYFTKQSLLYPFFGTVLWVLYKTISLICNCTLGILHNNLSYTLFSELYLGYFTTQSLFSALILNTRNYPCSQLPSISPSRPNSTWHRYSYSWH